MPRDRARGLHRRRRRGERFDRVEGSEHDLDPPGLYVEDAVDGHEIDVEVVDSAPVAVGEQASFDVKLDGITVDDIGLLVLLFGADNFGAFVRTA